MTAAPTSGSEDPLIGVTIGGRFRVEKRLAAGGMGVVYKAEQVPLGRAVAVKILRQPQDPKMDENFSKRFLLEAAAVANLSHPHTIVVHDYGRDGDHLYFAMEFVEGRTLTAAVRKGGPMDPWDVCHVGLQVASSVGDAHDQGLIHRDLKPGNIMLSHRGGDPLFVKVLDFGLVKMVTKQEGAKLTQSGIMLGSPRYMAPEQVRGKELDFRADIYSFGAMLCFMLTGKPPFPAGSQFEAMRAHVYTPAPRLRELHPGCMASERLEQLVLRCLAKDPAERPQSMREVTEALEHCKLAPTDTDDDLDAKATMLVDPGTEPSQVASALDQKATMMVEPGAEPSALAGRVRLGAGAGGAGAGGAGSAAPVAPDTTPDVAFGLGPTPAAGVDRSLATGPRVAPSQVGPAPSQVGPAPSQVGPAPSQLSSSQAAAGGFSEAPPPAKPKTSVGAWVLRVVLVLLVVGGAVAAALFLPMGDEGPGVRPRIAPPARDLAAAMQAPPPAEGSDPTAGSAGSTAGSAEGQPAWRPVELRVDPSPARVTRGGADLGDAPLRLRIPEGEVWTLQISARGYRPMTVRVDGSRDQLDLELEPDERGGDDRVSTDRRSTDRGSTDRRSDDRRGTRSSRTTMAREETEPSVMRVTMEPSETTGSAMEDPTGILHDPWGGG